MKKAFFFLIPFILSGCINPRFRPDTVGTGIYKVTESKTEGGQQEIRREEITRTVGPNYPENTPRHWYSHDEVVYNNNNNNQNTTSGRKEIVYESHISTKPYNGEAINSDKKPIYSDFAITPLYSNAKVWTDLSTNFSTNKISIQRWKHSVSIGGNGMQVNALYNFVDSLELDVSLGLNYSHESNNYINNNVTEGGYHISENVISELTSFSMTGRMYANEYLYLIAGFGVIGYEIRTSVSTDLSQYEYEGLEGERNLLAANFGLGLCWPNSLRFKPVLEVSCWLPTDELSVLEHGAGQVSAGIQVNF
ncbi:MAG: hypothetical protein A3J83_05465 [Elusimicrobia bacterium RIFOXYA2_FULL_40_6]|nr:MAG: hypothetical protein A3J83_05465 [Elusimicrobia bacterium RIFOXYA2_FULL_40_6]